MAGQTNLLNNVRKVLAQRWFTDTQIEKIIPRLRDEYLREPELLHENIDTWNTMMRSVSDIPNQPDESTTIPMTAKPPSKSYLHSARVDMNTILADVEPDLLLLCPEKLKQRHHKILGLGIIHSLAESWLVLFNSPRGFYMQDWVDLTKKIYYIEHHLLDFLFDKNEQKGMVIHPLVKHAASVESDFDHIRTRYLFASRCGYKSLSHLYTIQSALNRPTLGDLLLVGDDEYLRKFAPFCSVEEYSAFANLIKNNSQDEDDAEIFEKLAELNSLSHRNSNQ